ncbi:MAG: ABC transporter permease subunit [Thiohalomonadales bacterium]|nr:ABC transporter permease subunit [Thiohalomonadales bacterium]
MMILTLALRELRSLFLSPMAWSILAVTQVILAFIFLALVEGYIAILPQLALLENAPGITERIVAPLYGSAAWLLMMIVPLLTMRIISDERRNHSLTLLLSAPISMTEIIIGKYLGILLFLVLTCLMISTMPLSLLLAGHLDSGHISAIILALLLLIASFAALGLYLSTLTVQPTVAAIGTYGALLLLWIIDVGSNNVANAEASGLLTYLSMLRHFDALARGVFSSADVIYFVLFIFAFVVLSIRRLDAERLQQ